MIRTLPPGIFEKWVVEMWRKAKRHGRSHRRHPS